MIDPGLLGVIFGLASAASWGAGDFSGGVATKRTPVYGVVILSQAVGLALLIGMAFSLSEPVPAYTDLIWGGAAGIVGGIGLAALYQGLATGLMGVVAPVAAVVTAAIPVVAGLFLEGMPVGQQIAGFGLALVAVWLVSQTGSGGRIQMRVLGLPLLAGVGFGLFLIGIGQTSKGTVLWPLAAARLASITMVIVLAALTRQRVAPATGQVSLIVLVGLFDTGGNAFYALAAQAGRLDVAAVLSSLYPAGTVLLARFVLKEPISRSQWIGMVAALLAVLLIAS